MNFAVRKIGLPLLLFALAFCAPRVAISQEPSSEAPASSHKDKAHADKIKLSDATRVSTEEAAKKAAIRKAKGDSASATEPKNEAAAGDHENEESSQATELQPSVKAEDEKNADGNGSTDRSERKRTKIHGSVYGAAGSEARASGAEVGAGSKSGKTHVYVETGRTETPQPH